MLFYLSVLGLIVKVGISVLGHLNKTTPICIVKVEISVLGHLNKTTPICLVKVGISVLGHLNETTPICIVTVEISVIGHLNETTSICMWMILVPYYIHDSTQYLRVDNFPDHGVIVLYVLSTSQVLLVIPVTIVVFSLQQLCIRFFLL